MLQKPPAAEHLKAGYCLTLLSEATRKLLGKRPECCNGFSDALPLQLPGVGGFQATLLGLNGTFSRTHSPCSCLGSADIGFAESNTLNVHRSGRTAAILDPFVVSASAPCKLVIIGNLPASK